MISDDLADIRKRILNSNEYIKIVRKLVEDADKANSLHGGITASEVNDIMEKALTGFMAAAFNRSSAEERAVEYDEAMRAQDIIEGLGNAENIKS